MTYHVIMAWGWALLFLSVETGNQHVSNRAGAHASNREHARTDMADACTAPKMLNQKTKMPKQN